MQIKEPTVSPLYYARFLIKNPSGQVEAPDGSIIRPKVWPRDCVTKITP